MAYFSNSTDGAAFEHQCSMCRLNDASCPIAAVQFNYNYDAVNNEVATKILGGLVKNNGQCLMYVEIEKACEGNPDADTGSGLHLADVNAWLLYDFPENMPLYKDSGLWGLWDDQLNEMILQQEVNESDIDFIERCKALR